MGEIPDDIMKAAKAVYYSIDQDPVHAIAKAILAERERSRWQTMDTAPNDGTTILLRLSNGEVFSGWCRINKGSFRCHATGPDIGWLNAKHWMHLPKPPEPDPSDAPPAP